MSRKKPHIPLKDHLKDINFIITQASGKKQHVQCRRIHMIRRKTNRMVQHNFNFRPPDLPWAIRQKKISISASFLWRVSLGNEHTGYSYSG